jgi:hypothetical protein
MHRYITGLSAVALLAFSGSSVHAALVGYWPFNEGAGTTTEDVAGSNDGAFVNLASGAWDTANFAPVAGNTASIEFGNATDGATGYVDVGDLGVSGTGTISLWVNADNTSGDRRIYGQIGSVNTSTPGAASLGVFGDTSVYVWSGAAWQSVSPPSPIATGSWHHLAFVYQGGTVSFYVDGNFQGANTSGFDFSGADGRLGIGARYYDTYGNAFDGRIDDVSVWNEALSVEQIGLLAEGVSALSLVPEPASLALLGAGGLLALRRRRA